MKLNNPVVICFEGEETYFNNLYIPDKKTLNRIKCFLDSFIDLDDEEIKNINKNITEYWKEVEEESQKNENKIWRNYTKEVSVGYIYIYKQGNKYKIGRSSKLDCRNKKYITENPDLIEIVFKAKVKDYSKAEQKLHKLFINSRINKNREWFLLNDSQLEFFKDIDSRPWTKDFSAEIILNKIKIV